MLGRRTTTHYPFYVNTKSIYYTYHEMFRYQAIWIVPRMANGRSSFLFCYTLRASKQHKKMSLQLHRANIAASIDKEEMEEKNKKKKKKRKEARNEKSREWTRDNEALDRAADNLKLHNCKRNSIFFNALHVEWAHVIRV